MLWKKLIWKFWMIKRLIILWMKFEYFPPFNIKILFLLKKLLFVKVRKNCVLLWIMLAVEIWAKKLNSVKLGMLDFQKKSLFNISFNLLMLWNNYTKKTSFIEILKQRIFFWMKILKFWKLEIWTFLKLSKIILPILRQVRHIMPLQRFGEMSHMI